MTVPAPQQPTSKILIMPTELANRLNLMLQFLNEYGIEFAEVGTKNYMRLVRIIHSVLNLLYSRDALSQLQELLSAELDLWPDINQEPSPAVVIPLEVPVEPAPSQQLPNLQEILTLLQSLRDGQVLIQQSLHDGQASLQQTLESLLDKSSAVVEVPTNSEPVIQPTTKSEVPTIVSPDYLALSVPGLIQAQQNAEAWQDAVADIRLQMVGIDDEITTLKNNLNRLTSNQREERQQIEKLIGIGQEKLQNLREKLGPYTSALATLQNYERAIDLLAQPFPELVFPEDREEFEDAEEDIEASSTDIETSLGAYSIEAVDAKFVKVFGPVVNPDYWSKLKAIAERHGLSLVDLLCASSAECFRKCQTEDGVTHASRNAVSSHLLLRFVFKILAEDKAVQLPISLSQDCVQLGNMVWTGFGRQAAQLPRSVEFFSASWMFGSPTPQIKRNDNTLPWDAHEVISYYQARRLQSLILEFRNEQKNKRAELKKK